MFTCWKAPFALHCLVQLYFLIWYMLASCCRTNKHICMFCSLHHRCPQKISYLVSEISHLLSGFSQELTRNSLEAWFKYIFGSITVFFLEQLSNYQKDQIIKSQRKTIKQTNAYVNKDVGFVPADWSANHWSINTQSANYILITVISMKCSINAQNRKVIDLLNFIMGSKGNCGYI